MTQDGIWAVTTYFNPCQYQTRISNYRLFRQFLQLPLCTVEHSLTDQFDLGPQDAELLIQLSSPDVLWQKERLLNVAFANLPRNATVVLWLDCDVVFTTSVAEPVTDLLRQYAVVQCYSQLLDLPPWDRLSDAGAFGNRKAFATVLDDCSGELCTSRHHEKLLDTCPGGAWAASREFVDRFGVYDAFILGGGDRAFASACSGHLRHAETIAMLSGSRAAHYCTWAAGVKVATGGKVGVVPGTLLHLWHGDLVRRGYKVRHELLNRLGFDPEFHIEIGPSGAWQWAKDTPSSIQESVHQYFLRRAEDGTDSSTALGNIAQ